MPTVPPPKDIRLGNARIHLPGDGASISIPYPHGEVHIPCSDENSPPLMLVVCVDGGAQTDIADFEVVLDQYDAYLYHRARFTITSDQAGTTNGQYTVMALAIDDQGHFSDPRHTFTRVN